MSAGRGVPELRRQLALNEALPEVKGSVLFYEGFLHQPQTVSAVDYLRKHWVNSGKKDVAAKNRYIFCCKTNCPTAHLQKWILSRAAGFKRRINPKQATMKTPVFSDDILRHLMLLLTSLAIVMMGIHLAASILSIILLSLFLAIVLAPVVALLCRTRLPRSFPAFHRH
ncbi:MAG: hypothetical protein ACR5LD_01975 [Symbiopectobacterium sp.]